VSLSRRNCGGRAALGGSCGGGTLAYTEVPIADGWRIRFCEEHVWSDGPGAPGSNQVDIQGVATHELGHALGLAHTQMSFCPGNCVADSTMCPFYCNGVGERTIATDDANGLQAIYGAITSTKPVITGISGSTNRGGTLVITGTGFAATVNVKFTAGAGANTGTIPGVVYGVPSASGGTQVSVTIPPGARDGNVLVWIPQNRLSNPFPIDIDSTPPTVTAVSPGSGYLRGGETISVFGTDFTSAATVAFDGVPATIVTFVGPTQIDVQAPPGIAEAQVAAVTVSQPSGTATLASAYTYDPNPVPDSTSLLLSPAERGEHRTGRTVRRRVVR
jgi:hypothetical protein